MATKTKKKSGIKTSFTNTKGQKVTVMKGGEKRYTGGGVPDSTTPGKTNPSKALKDLSISMAGGGSSGGGVGTEGSNVRRYTTPYEDFMGDGPTDFTDKDADNLRRTRYKQAQGQIDSVNDVFDQRLSQVKADNLQNTGRTRAVTARGGLTGSGRGEGMRLQTEEYNRGNVKDVETQRMEKVNSIFADIDARVDREVEARRLEVAGQKEAYGTFLKEQTESARQQMSDLASLGVTLDELAPEDKEDFLKYTGMDELTFKTAWNKMLPKEAQIDYKYEVTDRGVLAYGINPKTGALETQTYALPSELAPGEELKEFDGVLYATSRDANGKVILRPLAQKAPTGGGVTGTYTPGDDPVVDSWVAQIKAGKTKISSVPKEYKNKVIVALEQATGTSLSSDIETAEEIVRLAKELRDDTETLGNVVGPLSSKTPTLRGDSATYKAKVNRLKALISKANLATMRGLGSMSNIEFENMQAIGSALGVEIGESGFTEELQRIIDTNEESVKDAKKNVTGIGAGGEEGEVNAENIDSYLDENPDVDAALQKAIQENPDMTDEEILYFINGK